LTAKEAEKCLLDQLAATKDNPAQAMWMLGNSYKQAGQVDKATEYFNRLLETAENLETRAQLIFSLGQTAEKMEDYALAADFYRHALAHEPTDKFHWYFIHNNLGYSLVQLGDFDEAQKFCRAAIQIDPERSNAHKNLGLAYQGQGRDREAAECFVAATQANASDARDLGLLEALLMEHPDLEFDFASQLECCRKAVEVAARERERALEEIKRRDRQKPSSP
jgi:tetratricopeptide (TPR) repeat protein